MAQIKAQEISDIIKKQIQDYEKAIDLAETGTVNCMSRAPGVPWGYHGYCPEP